MFSEHFCHWLLGTTLERRYTLHFVDGEIKAQRLSYSKSQEEGRIQQWVIKQGGCEGWNSHRHHDSSSAEQGYQQYLFTQLLTVLSYVKYLIQCELQRRAPQGAVYAIVIKSKTLQPDCLHLKAALLFPCDHRQDLQSFCSLVSTSVKW